MKVFVAVRLGTEEEFEGVEGELVRPSQRGDQHEKRKPSFVGVGSGRSCPYARVADLTHLGVTPFRSVFFDALVRDEQLEATNANQRWAMEWAEQVLATADALAEGTVVEFDGRQIRVTASR